MTLPVTDDALVFVASNGAEAKIESRSLGVQGLVDTYVNPVFTAVKTQEQLEAAARERKQLVLEIATLKADNSKLTLVYCGMPRAQWMPARRVTRCVETGSRDR